MGALATACASATGCVADRPSRNGVFNENQYVRKDFLIRNADGKSDPGWMLKATVTEVSTPDPLGDVFGIFAGSENGGENGRQHDRLRVTHGSPLQLDVVPRSRCANLSRYRCASRASIKISCGRGCW